MFYKLGLVTYYGPNLINDLAELADNMLPYTQKAFGYYMGNSTGISILSSDLWYEERTDFSPNSIGTDRVTHPEQHGYELIHGNTSFRGKLLGGCLDTIYDLLTGACNPDAKVMCEKYGLFPSADDWAGKVLFIETSENCMPPEKMRTALLELESRGVFGAISGIIVGKPQNEVFYDEYKEIYKDVLSAYSSLPALYNINFGHAYPRTVLPYGVEVEVDINQNEIRFMESITA